MYLMKKWYTVLSYLICVIGLIVQVNEVSNNYFKYTTESKIYIITHEVIPAPSTSVCLRKSDILQRDKIKEQLGINLIKPSNAPEWDIYRNTVENFTLNMLFDFTPSERHLLNPIKGEESCVIRFPGTDFINTNLDSFECYSHFQIKKYHHRNMMCYKMIPKFDKKNLTTNDYVYKDDHFGLIYSLNLNEEYFNNVRRLSAYIHEPKTVEIYDSGLASAFRISDTKSIMTVSYQSLHIERAEPPYDTKCYRYPLRSAQTDQYFKRIQNLTYHRLNRSIPDAMLYEKLHTPLLSSYSLEKNETLRKIYRSIVEASKNNLPDSCEYRSTIPRIYIVQYDSLGVSLTWPDGFHVNNRSRPKSNLMDYIVYISSCIGTWFGISAIHSFHLIKCIKDKLFEKYRANDTMIVNNTKRSHVNIDTERKIIRLENRLDMLCKHIKIGSKLKIPGNRR